MPVQDVLASPSCVGPPAQWPSALGPCPLGQPLHHCAQEYSEGSPCDPPKVAGEWVKNRKEPGPRPCKPHAEGNSESTSPPSSRPQHPDGPQRFLGILAESSSKIHACSILYSIIDLGLSLYKNNSLPKFLLQENVSRSPCGFMPHPPSPLSCWAQSCGLRVARGQRGRWQDWEEAGGACLSWLWWSPGCHPHCWR